MSEPLKYVFNVPTPDGFRGVTVSVERADGEVVECDFADEAFAVLLREHRYEIDDQVPRPMLLTCPGKGCGERHVDEGKFVTKPHHTHACQHCGHVWRPAAFCTVGVRFLPGYKDGAP